MDKRVTAAALLTASLTAGNALAQDGDQRASFGDETGYNYVGDFSVGYKYLELEADTIRDAYVKTIGLNILQFEWFPEQATWMQNISWMAAIRPRLSYELTPDYNERTNVMSFLAFFHKAGEFLGGWMLPLATVFGVLLLGAAVPRG